MIAFEPVGERILEFDDPIQVVELLIVETDQGFQVFSIGGLSLFK
jgi:hypothetical protein